MDSKEIRGCDCPRDCLYGLNYFIQGKMVSPTEYYTFKGMKGGVDWCICDLGQRLFKEYQPSWHKPQNHEVFNNAVKRSKELWQANKGVTNGMVKKIIRTKNYCDRM